MYVFCTVGKIRLGIMLVYCQEYPPQHVYRTPTDAPRILQDASRTPGRPKRLFRSTWPNTLFRENRQNQARLFFRRGSLYSRRRKNPKKIDIVERCRKHIGIIIKNNIRPRWSLDTIARKNQESFATVEPQREALFDNHSKYMQS